jgi:DNA helicase-2/ATP-dependent DNA helicase PcrA
VFDYLERLDPCQRSAVTFDGGPLRVVAGAGTGKTTTLASRAAWLIGTGVSPERILMMTFTRRAARELINRTAALSDTRRPIHGGTFHSVAHQTLRRVAGSLGLADGFGVLDPGDAADVIDLVRDDHVRTLAANRRFPRKATLLDLYSRAVNTGQPIESVVAESTPWCVEVTDDIATICRGYVARKRSLGVLDFDDLLLYWRAAARHGLLGPRLARQYDHICVDEYQDVNALQVDIVAALRQDDQRLTVVGDDAQAVYGFRGADPRHLLEIDQVFPTITTIHLGRNFRSTAPICALANAVADDAPSGFLARLHTPQQGSTRPVLVRCADEDGEVDEVCRRVLEAREQGVALRRQAVLVRTAHHSDLLELELSRRRIPFVKYGGLRFLEAAHVKDLVCLFRLADNRRDELAWFRLLQLIDGVGPVTARKAIVQLGLTDTDDDEVLMRWPLAAAALPESAVPLADQLAAALPRRDGESVGAHAERLRDVLVPLIESAYEHGAARVGDLDALVAAAAGATRLSEVAGDMTLEPPASTGELAGPPLVDEDWLVISTIHSAKGLEWEVVHLLHASDGNLPADMSLGSTEGLEEERRLFYVALTRAQRALNVYVPLRYHHRPRQDAHSYGQLSRFLTPAVRAHLDDVTAIAEIAAVQFEELADVIEVELGALFGPG